MALTGGLSVAAVAASSSQGWNQLDFIVVLIGWVPFVLTGLEMEGNLTGLRAIRAIRPLRTLTHLPGMKKQACSRRGVHARRVWFSCMREEVARRVWFQCMCKEAARRVWFSCAASRARGLAQSPRPSTSAPPPTRHTPTRGIRAPAWPSRACRSTL